MKEDEDMNKDSLVINN